MTRKFFAASATAAALSATVTVGSAAAGEYSASLGKTESGQEVSVAVWDLNVGEAYVKKLSFGAIKADATTSLDTSVELTLAEEITLTFDANYADNTGDLKLDVSAKAADLRTSFGLLTFDVSLREEQTAATLSLSDLSMWDFEDASFLADLANIDSGMTLGFEFFGETSYGVRLEASGRMNLDNPRTSNGRIVISGRF